jgi:hypothetical protein
MLDCTISREKKYENSSQRAHDSEDVSGLRDEDCATGMTAVIRAEFSPLLFVVVRHALVPEGHYPRGQSAYSVIPLRAYLVFRCPICHLGKFPAQIKCYLVHICTRWRFPRPTRSIRTSKTRDIIFQFPYCEMAVKRARVLRGGGVEGAGKQQ